MKKIIPIFLCALIVLSCTEATLEDVGFTIKSLPAYVAYGNPGGTVTEKVLAPSEGSTSAALTRLRIEAPGVVTSDVTVQFTFGGTAVFGTDFTVSGLIQTTLVPFAVTATAAGGSIKIAKSNTKLTVNDFEHVNLKLDYPTDGVKDGVKTLTITLTSATGADGTVYAVGRGGTNILKVATINIADTNVIFTANLNGASEVPANASTATGAATLNFNTATKIFVIAVTHSGLTVSNGHIHKAAVGASGAPVFAFASFASPINYTSGTLTAGQEADLNAGLYYVNLHSAAFPGGEIRGQLIKQ